MCMKKVAGCESVFKHFKNFLLKTHILTLFLTALIAQVSIAEDKNSEDITDHVFVLDESRLGEARLGEPFEAEKALLEAAEKGDIKTIELLLNNGLDINSQIESNGGFTVTALMIAVFYHQTEAIRFLLENGAKVDLLGASGRTELMYARRVEVARLLIDAGADINFKDKHGYTPLLMNGMESEELFHFLLDRGADAHCLYALLDANRPLRDTRRIR